MISRQMQREHRREGREKRLTGGNSAWIAVARTGLFGSQWGVLPMGKQLPTRLQSFALDYHGYVRN